MMIRAMIDERVWEIFIAANHKHAKREEQCCSAEVVKCAGKPSDNNERKANDEKISIRLCRIRWECPLKMGDLQFPYAPPSAESLKPCLLPFPYLPQSKMRQWQLVTIFPEGDTLPLSAKQKFAAVFHHQTFVFFTHHLDEEAL
ncbi:MAG: hypothetical protein AB1757_31015 [Acidobacteriota bacterium]